MDDSELFDIFRQEYDLKETDTPNTLLQRYIDRAVKFISELYPDKGLSHTHTVVDQTRYTIDDVGLIKLTTIYYTDLDSTSSVFGDPDIPTTDVINTSNSTYLQSQSFELVQRIETLKRLSPHDGEIVSHNTFDLIPTPDVAGNIIYYEFDKYRTIETLPDIFRDDIIDLVFYYIADKSIRKTLATQSGNRYAFDRKGNISTDQASQTSTIQSDHDKHYEKIKKSLQKKVMIL